MLANELDEEKEATHILQAERQMRLLRLLEKMGAASVNDLAELLKASPATVRRDLVALRSKGMLIRTHGGAVLRRDGYREPFYTARSEEQREEKEVIGAAAAAMVGDNDFIFIDVGTTPLEVARHLPGDRRITAVTNWVPVVSVLAEKPNIRTILAGGVVRPGELSTSGKLTENALKGFYFDKAFIGVGGIAAGRGFVDFTLEEVQVKQQVIEGAKEVIVVADHTKFGRLAPIQVCQVADVTTVVTTSLLPPDIAESYRALGLSLSVVPWDRPVPSAAGQV